jgi:fatty-acyl-CoA synthase
MTVTGDGVMSETGGSVCLGSATVYSLLRDAAIANAELTAVTFIEDGDTFSAASLTYRQFISRLHQMAHLFQELGVGRADVISILSPNVMDATIAFFAAEAVGIVNPLNFLLRPEEVAAMMRAVESKVLVTLGPEAPELWSVVSRVRSDVPSLRHIVTIGAASSDAISLCAALDGRSDAPPSRDLLPRAEDTAAYFHTGGTTGLPKIAQHLHRNQAFSAQSLANSWQLGNATRILNGLPIFHVAGSLLLGLSPLSRGGEVILPTASGFRNPRVVANYWKIVERMRVTIGGGIPTTLVSLLDVPLAGADISSLDFFMTGGTYLPPAIAKELKEKFGIATRQLYGMTETAGLIAASHHASYADPQSIGEVIDGAEVEVRELASSGKIGKAVADGKSGVLVTRGPHVFPGYLSGQAQPFTEDGWLISGDIGFRGADNRLVVTGRAKDIIIRSGHNIDPAVIEEAAVKHSAVGIAAAVGMPDPYAGEVPVVYLTLASGAEVPAELLMTHLTMTVPEPPARPRHVFILQEIPTTAVGKIDKTALRRDAAKRAAQTALSDLPDLDGESVDVSVREGEGGRLMVTVRLPDNSNERPQLARSISEILGRFGFAHEIVGA